jgi:hypothetical protein
MSTRLIRLKRGDDRYHVFVEKPSRKQDDGSAKVNSKGDTQPEYKVKPNTGGIRRGITPKGR